MTEGSAPLLPQHRALVWMLPVLLLALLGAGAVLYANARCVGLSPDSIHYLSAAHSLRPHTNHFPPLYPMALYMVHAIFGNGPDSWLPMSANVAPYLFAARWLNAALMLVNLVLLVAILWPYVRRLRWGGLAVVIAVAFAVVEQDLLIVHVLAWSEPLFITFTLSGVAALAAGLRQKQPGPMRTIWISLAALAYAAGLLTRFAGAAWIAAGTLTIFIHLPDWTSRLRQSLAFGVIACLPMCGWLVYNHVQNLPATDRTATLHGITDKARNEAKTTLAAWIAPKTYSGNDDSYLAHRLAPALYVLFGVTLAALIALAVASSTQRSWFEPGEPLPALLLISMVCYAILLVGSLIYFDAQTPLDDRILSPLYVLVLLFFVGGLARLVTMAGRRGNLAAAIAGALCSILLLAHGANAIAMVSQWHEEGIGKFSSRSWLESDLLRYVGTEVNLGTPIYSTAADGLTLMGANASLFPQKIDPGTGQPNPRYSQQMHDMEQRLLQGHGLVIYTRLASRERGRNMPTLDELRITLELISMRKLADGSVYQVVGPATQPQSLPVP